MKTTQYNPSPLEVEIAYALTLLKGQIEEHLSQNTITKIENHIKEDNPLVRIHMVDKDGDPHEVVVKIIQKADV